MYKYKNLSNQPKTSALYNFLELCLAFPKIFAGCVLTLIFSVFSGYKFIVVTTAITNSSRLLEALLDNRV